MKQYVERSQLTLVGKAWEIRHQLRLLSKSSAKTAAARPAPTLSAFLNASSRPN